MRKITTIFLFATFFFNANAQYSKKQLKELKKLEVKVVNRGLDLSATFVPYVYEGSDFYNRIWGNSLFEAGFDVGTYYRKDGTRVIKGRYDFDVRLNSVTIYDMQDNGRVCVKITFTKQGLMGNSHLKKNPHHRKYILEKLIESNP